jgi:hypothetical protein
MNGCVEECWMITSFLIFDATFLPVVSFQLVILDLLSECDTPQMFIDSTMSSLQMDGGVPKF